MRHTGRVALLCAACLPFIAACSLFSTPERPLSQREINARTLTREFAASFATEVELAADAIAERSVDPAIQLNALRWKLGASQASQYAATQMAPMMALLDTWALAVQMQQFLAGAAGDLFGAEQDSARGTAAMLATGAERLAHGLIPAPELAAYEAFLTRYVRDHPLTDLGFARVSVVSQWVMESGQQASLVATVGSVSQSMSDLSDRLRMIGDRAPSQAAWGTRLAIRDAGLGTAELQRSIDQVDASLDRLSRMAESSPEQLHAALEDLRASMLEVAGRFDASWGNLMATLQEERAGLAANIDQQREAAVQAFDAQRRALAADAGHVADQAIAAGGMQMRALIRELLLYGILLFLVLLGVPFAAGYVLGRSRARPH